MRDAAAVTCSGRRCAPLLPQPFQDRQLSPPTQTHDINIQNAGGFDFGGAGALRKPAANIGGNGGGFDFKFGQQQSKLAPAAAAPRAPLVGANQMSDDAAPLGTPLFGGRISGPGGSSGATPMSTSDGAAPPPRAAHYCPDTPASVLATDCTAATPIGGTTPLSGSQCTPVANYVGGGAKLASTAAAAAAADAAVVATPGAATAGAAAAGAAAKGPATWADVFMWHDPVSTAVIFALGVGAYAGASWLLSGGASVTPLSAVAYALLAHLGVNFARFLLSARWHASSMWEGSAWVDSVAERAVVAVRRTAALHDSLLSNRDPHATLAVATALWALAWLGATLSARDVLVTAYLSAFALPPLYSRLRPSLDARLATLRRATLGRVDEMGMPRTARLLALTAALAALFFLSTWAQFGIGFLVAATYWRTTLAPADVEAIRSAAGPLTHEVTRSVRKVRARLSSALDDARALCGSAQRPAPPHQPRRQWGGVKRQ